MGSSVNSNSRHLYLSRLRRPSAASVCLSIHLQEPTGNQLGAREANS